MLQIVIYKKLNFWEEYTPLPGDSRYLISDQGWAYRIEKLLNADILRLLAYRRVYRIEPPISSISICLYFVFLRRKFSGNSENS